MILKSVIFAICLTAMDAAEAQDISFIGQPLAGVKEMVREDYPDFAVDAGITRQRFNYLKYVNFSGTITWIFYFSEDTVCTSTKKVYEYGLMDQVIKELDEKFNPVAENTWEYSIDGVAYQVVMEEKDWYFTVRNRLKK